MKPLKIVFFTVFFNLPLLVLADDFQVTPSVKLKQEYSDNIFFTSTGELDDFITTVSPKVSLQERTELLDLRFDSTLQAIGYADNNDLNAIEHFHNGRLNYKLTPLLSFSGDASYKIDSRPDRDLTTSGLVLNQSDRETFSTSVRSQYSLTETINSFIGAGYSRDFFEDPTLFDSEQYNYNFGFSYDLGKFIPASSATINFANNRYQYTTGKVKNYSLYLGFSHSLTETYSYSFDVGPRYSKSSFFGFNTDEFGFGGNFAVNWRGETSGFEVKLSRDEQGISGSSGTTERTGLSGRYNENFTEDLKGTMLVDYRRNKSNTKLTGLTTNEETFSVSPNIRYVLSNNWDFEAYYNFTYINSKNSLGGSQDRYRNSYFILFNYKNPLFD